jgi:Raf kinase inhibitor-like YbhB/YbcL family protein
MSRVRAALVSALGLLQLLACGSSAPTRPSISSTASTAASSVVDIAPPSRSPSPGVALRVASPAFADGAPIPVTYSCSGANVPPPLVWGGVPAGTAELALVVDDPDAVGGRFVHWVVVGIPPDTAGIRAGKPPAGATVLPNSNGDRGYLGPCPPAGTGTHHYRFTLYALRNRPRLGSEPSATAAEAAIKRAALASARLVGLYES